MILAARLFGGAAFGVSGALVILVNVGRKWHSSDPAGKAVLGCLALVIILGLLAIAVSIVAIKWPGFFW